MTQFDKQIVAIIPPPSTIRQKLVQKMASKVMKSLEQGGQYYETFYCRWHDDMPRERTLQCVKAVAEIFLTDLCLAYDINDIKVNEAAIKAYHEVCNELDQRLSNKHEGYRQSITYFIYILKPFMDRFYIQAGRIYD